jgi:fido (protein-threonine AMPylation protein)
VTDDAESLAEQREARYVSNRIGELFEKPVQAPFDVAHLKAIHAHIFQDLPHHRPGIVRADTDDGWIKHRSLEGQSAAYAVHYAHRDVAKKIDAILREFGGSGSLRGLGLEDAARRIAQLYGDLDHAHGFYEGNSRTLREFTRALAADAGYALDWVKAGVGGKERNELYIARDVAVLERAFPGLSAERAMTTGDRLEYEAWFVLVGLRRARGGRTLEAVVLEGLVPRRRGLG